MKPTWRNLALGVGAWLAMSVAGVPAVAAPTGPAGPAEAIPSKYIAGYTMDEAGSGTIGTLTVPTIDCSAGDAGIRLGIGVEGPDSSEVALFAGIWVTCVGTNPYYYSLAQVRRHDHGYKVAPGDAITITVTFRKGRAVIHVYDNSAPWNSVTLREPSDPQLLHFGALPEFRDGNLMPVPGFSTVSFAKVVGVDDLAQAMKYARYQESTKQIGASKIRRGKNFRIVFKHH